MVVLIILFLLGAVGRAEAQQAACDPAAFAAPFAAAYLAAEPYAGAPPAVAEAACQRDAAAALLGEALGPVVGYKAAATSAAARQAQGLEVPVMGVILRDMLRPDGAEVAIADGARMTMGLNLLARIGPDGVDGIVDDVSALEAIDAFIPAVELADPMLPEGVPTGTLVAAMNAGVRLGVTGAPQPRGDMTPEDLEVVSARLTRGDAAVAEGEADSNGRPLNSVLFVVAEAKRRGVAIKPGDVIMLGGMGPALPATPGELTATFDGFGLDQVVIHLTLK